MSYAMSQSLQVAIFERLSNDPSLVAIADGGIHDAVPSGATGGLWIVLGEEDVRDNSHQTGAGAEHRFQVSVLSTAEGFAKAKTAAAAVSDALLEGSGLSLTRGRVISLGFLRARARRLRAGQTRRIDMTFRALLHDD